MAEMICMYCQDKFAPGGYCKKSPNGKHVGIGNGQDCVYCGRPFVIKQVCLYSPYQEHRIEGP